MDLVGQVLLVQHPQHGVLAEDARHDGHPEVDLPAIDADLEAAVLGHALFADIQLGHHLDPRDHLLGQFHAGHLAAATEHAVDAVLDAQAVAGHAQVDIAGVQLEGVVEGGVDQLDHHAGVFADTRQGQGLEDLAFLHRAGLGLQRFDGMEALLVAVEEGRQFARVDQMQRRTLALLLDPGQACLVEGIGEDAEGFAIQLQQHEFALERQGQGHPVECRSTTAEGVEGQYRVMQGGPQAAGEDFRWQVSQLVEGIHQAMPQLDRAIARGAHQLGVEALLRRGGLMLDVHRCPSRALANRPCRNPPLDGHTHASCQPFSALERALSR
ncbi:hypothetical protein D3C80_597610 [compost metagenome]